MKQSSYEALVRARLSNDDNHFWNLVRQEASHDKTGSIKALWERGSAARDVSSFVRLPTDSTRSELQASQPSVKLDDLVVDDPTRTKIQELIDERRNADLLARYDLHPSSNLLFHGFPGTGKTMTAKVFACELGMPLYMVQLDRLINSHLGQTATNLRKIFDCARVNPGVYLFDEFDAVASSRRQNGGDANGEMNRIVNSLLMMIEEHRQTSVVIATTNRQGALDPAVDRRFDAVIGFSPPSVEQAHEILRRTLQRLPVSPPTLMACARAGAALGIGHADLILAARAVAKRHLIYTSHEEIDEKTLTAEIARRKITP